MNDWINKEINKKQIVIGVLILVALVRRVEYLHHILLIVYLITSITSITFYGVVFMKGKVNVKYTLSSTPWNPPQIIERVHFRHRVCVTNLKWIHSYFIFSIPCLLIRQMHTLLNNYNNVLTRKLLHVWGHTGPLNISLSLTNVTTVLPHAGDDVKVKWLFFATLYYCLVMGQWGSETCRSSHIKTLLYEGRTESHEQQFFVK